MAEQSTMQIRHASPEEQQKAVEQVMTVVQSGAVPECYANAFIIGMSTGDVQIVCQRGSRPVMALNMSFTVAKSLASNLSQLVSELEKKSGREFLTTDDVANLMKEMNR